MATDNKKVSGYLPQYIFDVFEDFREKRSLSASSALITILSEYFQVDQKVEQSSLLFNNDFVSKEQFESLENKLSELSGSLLSELDKLVEQRFSSLHGELLGRLPISIEVQAVNIESEPSSELLNELVRDGLPSELKSSSPQKGTSNKSKTHDQLPLINSIEVIEVKPDLPVASIEDKSSEIAEILILTKQALQPLNQVSLSRRFGVDSTTLGKRRLKGNFTEEWSKSKDPNGIAWEYREEEKLYYPLN